MMESDWSPLAAKASARIRIGPLPSPGYIAVESSDSNTDNLVVSSCMFGNVDKIIGGVIPVSLMGDDAFLANAGRMVTVQVQNMGDTEKRIRVVHRVAPLVRVKVYMKTTDNPSADLLRLGKVRHALWQDGLVEGAPLGAHRDRDGRLFFTFRFRGDVKRVRAAVDPTLGAVVEETRDVDADECVNCGNRPGDPFPTICPNCKFRDISPCPSCGQEVPRRSYDNVAGDLFRCPRCKTHVRMEFNPDLFDETGHLREPAVVVRLGKA
jgi:hypothetical protein